MGRGDEGGDPPCWEGRVVDRRDLLPDLDAPAQIHDLVVDFYREVVFDPLLGPVFEEDAEVDWSVHIPHLIDYWCWILLDRRRYEGNVTRTHRRLHEAHPLRTEHGDRWLELWRGCVDARWSGPHAEHAKDHATTLMAGLARRVFEVDWPLSAPACR